MSILKTIIRTTHAAACLVNITDKKLAIAAKGAIF